MTTSSVPITITGPQSQLNFVINDSQKQIFLVYAGKIRDFDETELSTLIADRESHFKVTELQISGDNIHHKGITLTATGVGDRLKFVNYKQQSLGENKLVKIVEQDPLSGLAVESFYELFATSAVIRSWKTIINTGTQPIGLEYVSSFSYTGILQLNDFPGNYTTHQQLMIPNNGWQSELQWQTAPLKQLGLIYRTDGEHRQPTSKRISITNKTSWSCSEFSPNGILRNIVTNQVAAWQLENNGAWHYELSDIGDGNLLNLQLSGPEEFDSHWWKRLRPNEQFETIKVAFVQTEGSFEEAIDELTKYRREIRRANKDNDKLPVIFNDYMNGLMGDPTTAAELPLIDAAAKVGCEYFVIDCGWYSKGDWWDSIGDWQPSKERFPNGIQELTTKIRQLGMVPGLWLEIEAMGINSERAKALPDSWFFMHHGQRWIDVDRYHLDFRNPEVRKFAREVVDRLINDYQIGYIKMDYNITTGIGTDYQSDSFGDGLLAHNRAYLSWLDGLFEQYPNLVIENCGSGGMRHDYAMLSRHSIQSLTDQTDYLRNGAIAAAGPSAITPEQSAVWSYPLKTGDREEVIYNMVNALMFRIHQSGYLNLLDADRLELVQEGIQTYKGYRSWIKSAKSIWPTGLPHIDDEAITYGQLYGNQLMLAIWNCHTSHNTVNIDLSKYGQFEHLKQIYPKKDNKVDYQLVNNQLQVHFPRSKMARLFSLERIAGKIISIVEQA